jgi:signal transduction histidine kinase
LFAAKIRNRQITVMIEGGESVRFYGVIGQLRQVMANLISNALDAASLNSRIWLEAMSKEREVEITVRDEGVGMDEETRRQLFHRSIILLCGE